MRVIKHRRIAWRACGMYGTEEKCKHGSDGKSWEKEHIWNSEM